MTYRIEVKPSAADALTKIPRPHRQRIARKIDQLANNPRPRGAILLEGPSSLYRIRVGDYRVIYQIQDAALVVLVVRIGGRGDVYRHLP
ncbi:MAG: type II toxin-antitoxin system RelE/ParE family toxin [Pirellulales bacterium]|nr:type II toxin-antitoxin system RelE/ParE family toxin [Pirellulales bacterium]